MYVPVSYFVWYALAHIAAGLGIGGQCEEMAPLFHSANMVLHVLNAILVFRVLIVLFRGRDRGDSSLVLASLIGSAIFLLHPLQAEVVAWTSGLRDLISMSFCLSAFLLLLRIENKLRNYIFASILFFGVSPGRMRY
jgi:hypothetical protein